ncbi:uncharacterized protein K452DRAFT_224161 [Aplosporella prunicola CBS 121167]|uniref:Gamma interferon inducible lysosomal thiol reductase GILT n=1 Tax=Aplosporella prunicola CBS 121167 TaxID=1176127 RepID=A0A6A6BHQ4_9PEZI|nr:uncharacterized protein K452DRAFT_224161 [Aplosporella prunicola CBS 121167]KAF2143672.1 hypothetical protein K452DRAFT_224161 [Aplosporella prunicola CBS 121167]
MIQDKLPLPHVPRKEEDDDEQLPRRSTAWLFFRAAALTTLVLFLLFGRPLPHQTRPILSFRRHCSHVASPDPPAALVKKVPLEAHIMSKCPDALDCLSTFVLPTMAEVSDRIDFKLSYIGKPTDHDDGVECKHGQTECLGNMIELCAADQYPDPKIYLGFTMCLTRRYKEIPKEYLVHDCALEYGIDFSKLNGCLSRDDGGYVLDLLQASFQRSMDLNATISCTVRLNDKVRCVRDGGEWKDCDNDRSNADDLIHDVNDLYNEWNGLTA